MSTFFLWLPLLRLRTGNLYYWAMMKTFIHCKFGFLYTLILPGLPVQLLLYIIEKRNNENNV